MVVYAIIGIIVSIVELIMAYRDMKKLGLTIYDINPKLSQSSRLLRTCIMISMPIILAIVWPLQVYHWIRRFVLHK